MRRTTLLLTVMVTAVLLAFSGVALAQQNGGDQDRYIVVLRDGVDSRQVANEHAQQRGAQPRHIYQSALNGYSASIPAQALEGIQRDRRVAFIDRDLPQQAFAQTLPTGINRMEADLSSTKSGDGTGSVDGGVAVIDTGIDLDHPDLNVQPQRINAVQPTSTTDQRKNCTDPPTSDSADDDNGHGSHVAGTVGAKDDTNGVVGVAPGAKLYAVKVLNNEGKGWRSDIICGIDWVTANAQTLGIKLANMSLGGSGSDDGETGNTCANTTDAYRKAICNSTTPRDDNNDGVIDYDGVTYVVAAGNSGTDLKGHVPAAYNEVLTVTNVADFDGKPGALYKRWTCTSDRDDTARDSSNYTTKGHSDEGHTIAAPGTCIRSTYKNGGYATASGTSMASPHVAGSAVLCIASGRCSDTDGDGTMEASEIMTKLRTDAAAQPSSYGFKEDPHQVTSAGSKYYGYLVRAGTPDPNSLY